MPDAIKMPASWRLAVSMFFTLRGIATQQQRTTDITIVALWARISELP